MISIGFQIIVRAMGSPYQPVTISSDQLAELNRKLSDFRHNVNNHLALIAAASELVRRKPELAERAFDTLTEQPQKIMEEVRKFSGELEQMLGIGMTQ